MSSISGRVHIPRGEHFGSSGRAKSSENLSSVQIDHGSLSPKNWKAGSIFSVSDKENMLGSLKRAQAGTSNVAKVIIRDMNNRGSFNSNRAESAFKGISENLGKQISELRVKKAPKKLIEEITQLQTTCVKDRSYSDNPEEYLNKVSVLNQSIEEIYKKAASLKPKG